MNGIEGQLHNNYFNYILSAQSRLLIIYKHNSKRLLVSIIVHEAGTRFTELLVDESRGLVMAYYILGWWRTKIKSLWQQLTDNNNLHVEYLEK